jgi:hemoglobin-like flavoprotein
MKTAVEWLESEMLEHYSPFDNKLLYKAIHKAKEMEKEQIEDAWDSAYTAEGFFNAEQYYNETFKKQYDIK